MVTAEIPGHDPAPIEARFKRHFRPRVNAGIGACCSLPQQVNDRIIGKSFNAVKKLHRESTRKLESVRIALARMLLGI
jgi:hypothetical protein